MPGVGEFLAQQVNYVWARKLSPQTGHLFGKGAPEGIIVSEATNNAVPPAALIPMLALGIPGEELTAMMLAVFLVHNVIPGPDLFVEPARIRGRAVLDIAGDEFRHHRCFCWWPPTWIARAAQVEQTLSWRADPDAVADRHLCHQLQLFRCAASPWSSACWAMSCAAIAGR